MREFHEIVCNCLLFINCLLLQLYETRAADSP